MSQGTKVIGEDQAEEWGNYVAIVKRLDTWSSQEVLLHSHDIPELQPRLVIFPVPSWHCWAIISSHEEMFCSCLLFPPTSTACKVLKCVFLNSQNLQYIPQRGNLQLHGRNVIWIYICSLCLFVLSMEYTASILFKSQMTILHSRTCHTPALYWRLVQRRVPSQLDLNRHYRGSIRCDGFTGDSTFSNIFLVYLPPGKLSWK